MRTATLGGLEVSVVGLGCNNFGRALDKEGAARVVGAALDSGVTFFDTASNYGEGQSESFLGAALGSGRREVVICTKFGVAVPGWEGSGGASPDYVVDAVERSLRELGTDYIDLLLIHFPDEKTPIEDTLEAMDDLVKAGKVREIGCSNFDQHQLRAAMAVSAEASFSSFVCDQVQFSMVHRQPQEDGTLSACRELGIALIPFYPLGSGLLTGKTRRGQPPVGRLQMERYQNFLSDENFDIVEGLESFAAERGLSMVQVAIGWLLAQSGVPTVPAGATKVEQVRSNAKTAEWRPTDEDMRELLALIDREAARDSSGES